ncbi:YozE family protein [Jeotgalibacillus haloalkalitolerans]|uniref:YozE family protein n=1 Tax=Jeotgalibacillus haloalkalitolerans TaxID=3104292 RepID=A0ABU5KKZ2_9BACL|nr:YozE family protein [Jeotgalibacillus sp. HH7-29]MDZ5711939.1 YozE family protein [Jeotgalibacillus sp. HH7-29]
MKTFYHYVLKYREPTPRDGKEKLANKIYEDGDFPRRSKNYNEISQYIETTEHYFSLAVIFDELWDEYQTESK